MSGKPVVGLLLIGALFLLSGCLGGSYRRGGSG